MDISSTRQVVFNEVTTMANTHSEIKDEIIAIEKAIVALSSSFHPSTRWLIMKNQS
jgi:hypothetical protein